jgi:small basic protein
MFVRHLTGAGFEQVVMGQQFLYRALGILGLLLLGTGLGLSRWMSLLMTAIVSLGATIAGPAVLTVEYEPVPRGFALPFLLLALGLVAHRRWTGAAVCSGIGFLFHPPTALAFCAVMGCVMLWTREFRAAAVLVASAVLMGVFVMTQQGLIYNQDFFGQVDPPLEQLQRMRASYNWVSIWIGKWWGHYLLLWLVSLAAFYRIRKTIPPVVQVFCIVLPIVGVLSVPLSYLLLENWKWILVPQFQPGRYLLFVTLFAVLLASVAGIRATESRRYLEGFLFFLVPFASPTVSNLLKAMLMEKLAVILVLAAIAVLAVRFPAITVAAAVLPFVLIPTLGKVRNYPDPITPELNQLADWARTNTPKDSMFQFADVGQGQDPGVFRVRALRSLYVDWKSGGQVNFLRAFAGEWWRRWQAVEKVQPLENYRAMKIDYVVFQASHRLAGVQPVYENRKYVVYKD